MAGIGSHEAYETTVLAASGLVKAGRGKIIGFFVSSSSSGTIKVWDSLSAAGTVLINTTDAITAPAFLAFPGYFSTGLFVTIGGTASVSVLWA